MICKKIPSTIWEGIFYYKIIWIFKKVITFMKKFIFFIFYQYLYKLMFFYLIEIFFLFSLISNHLYHQTIYSFLFLSIAICFISSYQDSQPQQTHIWKLGQPVSSQKGSSSSNQQILHIYCTVYFINLVFFL